jgi:TonB family protein
MDAMNGISGFTGFERRENRLFGWMVAFSMLVHAFALVIGSITASLFPATPHFPIVTVELTEIPPSELLEEAPPPSREVVPSVPEPPATGVTPRRTTPVISSEQRWLKKLDAGLAKVPEAFVTRKEGRTGGIAVRNWDNRAEPRPGDFAPAVAAETRAELRNQVAELEERVLRSGKTGLGSGETTEVIVAIGGTGRQGGDPLPPWIREMIRAKVRAYLPELEAGYSTAIRRNPNLKGKLLVRFRIDPSGKVPRAVMVESSLEDGAFNDAVLEKIRRWTFDPPAGRTVDVLYPFVFVAPS